MTDAPSPVDDRRGVRRTEQIRTSLDEREAATLEELSRTRCTVQGVELRFGVEGVVLGRCPRHRQVDDAFCTRRARRCFRNQRPLIRARGRRRAPLLPSEGAPFERSDGEGAEAEATAQERTPCRLSRGCDERTTRCLWVAGHSLVSVASRFRRLLASNVHAAARAGSRLSGSGPSGSSANARAPAGSSVNAAKASSKSALARSNLSGRRRATGRSPKTPLRSRRVGLAIATRARARTPAPPPRRPGR